MSQNYRARFGIFSILCASASCAVLGVAMSHLYDRPDHAEEMRRLKSAIIQLSGENKNLRDVSIKSSQQQYRMQKIHSPDSSIISEQRDASVHLQVGDDIYADSYPQAPQDNTQTPSRAVGEVISSSERLIYSPSGYIDTHLRMGNRKSLASSEIFYPFAWNGKFLGFADVRLTAATDSSIEGNAGIGIRRLNDNRTGILGFYGYIDQRRTEYNNQFTQMTVGTEWLAEDWEVRANSYIPLSGKKHSTQLAPTSFTLSGTGLVAVGGTNIVTEIPNYGFDFELGKKLPIPEYNYLKNIWAYVGGYYFNSDETPTITGYRLRTELDVTDKLSFGAEWRQDNIRDNEMIVEARLRFPFGGDEKTKQDKPSGIYERLTQQPVRDVDIVVQSNHTTNTSSANVLNTDTGTQQRIITVNNTASGGGDGTTALPYNSLAAAQAAANAGDIIYVAYGDGTSTGMDTGLTLNKNGQSLIGSGSALTYDSSRMNLGGASFSIPDGTIILQKGLSPILTNIAASSDILTITGDDILVSGLTLDSARRNGISLSVSGAANDTNGTILRNLNILTPTNNGINVSATASAMIDGLTLDAIKIDNCGAMGLSLTASGANSTINNFSLTNSNIINSHTHGMQLIANSGGDITSPTIKGTHFTNPGDYGIYSQTTGAGSTLSDLTIDDVSIDNSGSYSIYLLAQNTAQVTNPHISNTNITSAGEYGIYNYLQNAGTQMSGLSITDSTISGSATSGIYVLTQAGTSISNSIFSGLTLDNNYDNGLSILATGVGTTIDQMTITDITTKNSGLVGLLLQATTSGQLTNTTIDNLVSSGNGSHGLHIYTNGSSATIDNLTVQNVDISDNRANGVYVQNSSTGGISGLSFSGLKITDSRDSGMLISSTASGSIIDDLTISNLEITDTGTLGLILSAATAGQITNVNLSDITVADAGTNALQISASGTGATIDGINVTNVTLSDAGASGALIQASTTGIINQLSFAGLHISDSSDYGLFMNGQRAGSQITNFTIDDLDITNTRANSGLYIYAQTGSLIQNGTLSDMRIDGAGDRGLYLATASSGSLLDNIQISDATINDAAYDGLRLYASAGGSLTNIDISALDITASGENGIYLQSTTAGSTLTGITLSDVSVTGSATSGIYIQGSTNGELSVALDHVTSTANYDYGIYIDDDTTSPYTVDLGGGALSSAGGNRIYNNYLQEVRLDYDGANLFAHNNWWGNAAGLIAAERTLEVLSTIDTTGFLTSDPGL